MEHEPGCAFWRQRPCNCEYLRSWQSIIPVDRTPPPPEPPFVPVPRSAVFSWHDETRANAWPSVIEQHVQETVQRHTRRCEAFLECILQLTPEHKDLIRTHPQAIPMLLQGQSLHIIAGQGYGKAHRAILWKDILERIENIPASEPEIHKAAHYYEMLQDEAGRALVEDILKRKRASMDREERRNGER